ncbi:hypothetical protein OAA60_00795 [Porticoccaceae bacterium]|nr:hypothetical protein [Porticoccaceae bacterium]
MTSRYAVRTNRDQWFEFTDGHFHLTDRYESCSGTNDLKEAIRMLDYAVTLDTTAKIVTNIQIMFSTVTEIAIEEEVRKSIKQKLSDREAALVNLTGEQQ